MPKNKISAIKKCGYCDIKFHLIRKQSDPMQRSLHSTSREMKNCLCGIPWITIKYSLMSIEGLLLRWLRMWLQFWTKSQLNISVIQFEQNYLDDQCSREPSLVGYNVKWKKFKKIFRWKSHSKKNKQWIYFGKNVLVLERFMKITQLEWSES